MTTLYWDCFSGIAGNMVVASLLDLGASRSKLIDGLKSMHFAEGPVELIIDERLVDGIRGLYFNTREDEPGHHHDHKDCSDSHTHVMGEAHDHDERHGNHPHHPEEHEHSHCHNGSSEKTCDDHEHDEHNHDHEHEHEHEHDHEHDHEHEHGHGHAPHRGLKEICGLIERSAIAAGAKKIAISCFKALAEAEATVHGKTADEVHFHEVGARDSIADIVGAAICLDDLGISEVLVSPVHLGSGLVRCAHGIMPVPAPATALLLRGYQVIFDADVRFELTTPTGAAILRGMGARHFEGRLTLGKVGHGHGSHRTGRANFLRAFLVEPEMVKKKSDQVTVLITNIDNATGEELGHALSELMQAGALDVCLLPVLMKKGRPGHQLQVMTSPEDAGGIETLIFNLLPTIGIRHTQVERTVLERSATVIDSDFGQLAAKQIRGADGVSRREPEFDELVRVAREQQSTPRKIKQRIVV